MLSRRFKVHHMITGGLTPWQHLSRCLKGEEGVYCSVSEASLMRNAKGTKHLLQNLDLIVSTPLENDFKIADALYKVGGVGWLVWWLIGFFCFMAYKTLCVIQSQSHPCRRRVVVLLKRDTEKDWSIWIGCRSNICFVFCLMTYQLSWVI